MVVPDATELFFSIIFSYMGALEFFFIARNLYHWGFKHHKRLLELTEDDTNGLSDLQDKIKAAIEEAKEKEVYGLNAMKDGVLYKNGFRVSPDSDLFKNHRQVIGSSRNSIENKDDSITDEITEVIDSKYQTELQKQQNEINKYDKISDQNEYSQEVVEEPFVEKRVHEALENSPNRTNTTAADNERTKLTQTIKTQYGQVDTEQYLTEKISPETESVSVPEELQSTQRSDFSNEDSSDYTDSTIMPGIHFNEYERPEPDGQDVNEPQYSDDYLRSLDGIKYRPLVRDDGTGRRRAFKKRRSSGDSTSSRESRASREEEVKMFTSLEEEEFESIRRGDTEYTPIRYSSESNLKIGKQSRHRKRSPISGSKDSEENHNSSEQLNQEITAPWGDVKPEHYKDSEFWKNEKAISIEEEHEENLLDKKQETDITSTEEAIQKCTSPSPARNIPHMSSFEAATESQHEDAISSLKRRQSREVDAMIEKEDQSGLSDKEKNVSMYESSNENASSPIPADQIDASNYANENKNSFETDENVVHDQQTDELIRSLSSPLQKSPRQNDMEQYEEHFVEEEKKNSRTPSPRSLELKNDEVLEHTQEEDSKDESVLQQKPEDENNSTEMNQNIENQTPKIEINYAPDIERTEKHLDDEDNYENEYQSSALMEGVSDFYDFNASANSAIIKSRSQSRSRDSVTPPIYIGRTSRSRSRGSSPRLYIKSTPKVPAVEVSLSSKDISGVSDWHDYNVMLNRVAYGMKVENFREIPETSTDHIVSQLKSINETKSDQTKNEEAEEKTVNLEKASENLNNESIQTPTNQNEEPPTPQYPRSFSAEWQNTEKMIEEYKQQFKRSTYVGESADFSDELEELREQTRHFRRSRSKSRTPNDQDVENVNIGKMAMRRKLQEKILAQITKTTLDYQDFAKDINSEFLDHERRGSDSALLQKSEILIQFQDDQLKNGDYDDTEDLDSEDYHHFRRFSLNQEAQVEEYPNDQYVYEYVKEIDLKKEKWMSEASSTEQVAMLTTNEIFDEILTHANANDQEDSGSDDERQTVVEVEDEIDEDIWDYDKSEDFNEQSECEEAEREADRYINHSASDWKEEGAVGGVSEWQNKYEIENAENIDELYDEAIKHIAEGKIEKDYENIIESISTEDQFKTESIDNISVKTDDLLDEILLNDERKYGRLSPRNSSKSDIKRSTQNFIDEEKEDIEYYVSTATVVHHDTKSTRLRSRYGLPPSTQFRNFDYEVDDAEIDLNYKPKKEYNWRKNFKIDDEDDENNENQISEANKENITDSQGYDIEEENTYNTNIENENQDYEMQSYSEQSQFEITSSTSEFVEKSNYRLKEYEETRIESKNVDFIEETEQSEVISKKKKKKTKIRKGSKASLGEDDISNLTNIEIALPEDDQADSSSKKKLKKKKKSKIDSNHLSPKYKSPEPDIVKKSEFPELKSLTTRISPNTEVTSRTKSKSPEDKTRIKSQSPAGAIGTQKIDEIHQSRKSISPQPLFNTTKMQTQSSSGRPTLERTDSSGVYDLIKDGSMYPWFS